MKSFKQFTFLMSCLFLAGALMLSCEGPEGEPGPAGTNGQDGQDGEDGTDVTLNPTMFENKSGVEPLVAMSPQFNFVKAYSLISSSDAIGTFRLAGSADGAGFQKVGTGYRYVVNCEDSYAVARINFDANMKPVSGDYLLNSGVADLARQCSGTLLESAIHGGTADIFLSASENFSYDIKGINPAIATPTPTADFGLDALGEFAWENAVPLPKNTYAGKTVIIGGDDDDSGSQGQVTLYYSEAGNADLTGGKIYVLRFKQISNGAGGVTAVAASTTYSEANLDFGVEYDVEFVEIVNGAAKTLAEMETACTNVNASQFMRVEDVDYRKGADANARQLYFTVTGRGPSTGTYNDWGTVYKLVLDAASPLTGKLKQIVSGNTTGINKGDGNLSSLQSPDNICVTENFIYIQEDPNSFSRNHSSYIYQADLNGGNIKQVLELVERSDLSPTFTTGHNGEFGSLIDISDKVGVPNTFILAVQPHYWTSNTFKGLDGHDNTGGAMGAGEDNQASQIVLIKGLPR